MPHLPDHVTHDPELIAAYAAGDATGSALDQATDLVASCTECAELHRDLRAISTALPELPVPVRPRDFRLTPEQAAALRPAGWRGVLAAFAAPRFRLAAPLGAGLAAAGLAGLLLASPGGLLPRAGDATTTGTGAGAPAIPAAGAGAAGAVSAASAGTAAELAPERLDDAKASAAASAIAAPAPQPGAFAPDASPASASAAPSPVTDTLHALGTTPAASDGRTGLTSNQPAPSVGAPAPTDQRAPDVVARDLASTIPGPEAAIAPATESQAIPVIASTLLVVGLALIVLRVIARRLA